MEEKYLLVGDDVSDLKIYEIINKYFGKSYTGWMKAWYDINDEFGAWFPKITETNDRPNGRYGGTKSYSNTLSEDETTITEINHDAPPIEGEERSQDNKLILVFARIENKFKFLGVFKRESDSTNEHQTTINKKIAEGVRLSDFELINDFPFYDFTKINEVMDEFGLGNKPVTGTMRQIAPKDTTVHYRNGIECVFYSTEGLYTGVTESNLRDEKIKIVDASDMNKDQLAEMIPEVQTDSNTIACIKYGNKVLNPSTAPNYQPHEIICRTNTNLIKVIRIMSETLNIKYSVNDAVWIAAALMSYEQYVAGSRNIVDFSFQQMAIVERAEKISEGKVNSARVSTHCCGDHEGHSHAYLRQVDIKRRLAFPNEFSGGEEPIGLNMEDLLETTSGQITMKKLFDFVHNEYKALETTVIKKTHLKEMIEHILDEYVIEKRNPLANNPMAKYLSKEAPEILVQAAGVSEEEFLGKGSAGQGGWTAVPWVALFNRSITETATKGVYIVYLMEQNGNSMYLTFNQGCTDIRSNHSKKETISIMRERAEKIVAVIDSQGFNTDQDINLGDNLPETGELYQKGCIFYKEYKKDSIPSEAELRTDLLKMLDIYNQYVEMQDDGFWPTLEEYDPGLSADDYINVLTNESIINKSWLDVLVYLYRMGGIGTCKQIANKYGNKAAHYNANGINIAKAVAKETSCPMSIREDNGKERYWPVLFFGKDVEGSTEEGEFIYKMRETLMEAIKTLEERGEFQDMSVGGKTEFDKNLILYGPPGTGKTYNSAIYAVAICDGKSVEELTDYDAVMKRYNELKKQGRVAFTTFHQSYGYEEFIEGIKPVVDEESKDVSYSVEPGVFKKFCEIARTPADIEVDPNACIWFMRLEDNAKTLKDTCFANETLLMDIKQDDTWTHDRFVEGMKIGDYVLSYAGSSVFIDAVGVIEGEAEYDEAKESYQWSRKVKWTRFSEKVNVKEINGNTYLPNFSIAKMSHMKLSDLLRLLPGVNTSEEEKPYVFIIDEINRGNISKIFGELITLIENTKREGMDEAASAILPYSNQPFSVPSNVYILGTMNTADRSIALMDTALRRRFQFVEMMPDADLLDKVVIEGLNIGKMLQTINKRIEFLYDREHTIGHAFFMGLKAEPTIEKLASIFSKSVIPLLQEYFYEDYQKIQLVLGDNAKKDEDGDIKFIKDKKVVAKDIFVGNVEDVIDLPEKSYSINSEALFNIESYKKIAPEQ